MTISASNAGGTGAANLTIIVLPLPPVITNGLVATGTSGEAFNYQITATNSPTSFTATGLPVGLGFDPVSGVIRRDDHGHPPHRRNLRRWVSPPADSPDSDCSFSAAGLPFRATFFI